MSFSRAQQPEYRALVFAAWAAHCRHEGLPVTVKEDRDWYEGELLAATGQATTAGCNAGRDYDRAMAHFEALAGVSIKWQMRLHSGDERRILHELHAAVPATEVDGEYLRGVARRMLRLDYLPELEALSREELIAVMGEVKRSERRRARREGAAVDAVKPVCPF